GTAAVPAAAAATGPRVLVTGCWATSDPTAARALPGVTAVVTHHADVAAELDRLLLSWQSDNTDFENNEAGENEPGKDPPQDAEHARRQAAVKPVTKPLTDRAGPATPPPQNDEWDERDDDPESLGTPLSKSSLGGRVNDKIVPLSTPEAADGTGRPPDDAGHPGPGLTLSPGLSGEEGGGESSGGDLDRQPSSTARSDPHPNPLPDYRGRGPEAQREREPQTKPGAAAPPVTGFASLPLLVDHQTGRQRALLKVQDGCDAHCTYCIIPKLRPALWSKPVDDAVAEARRLVDGGHVELVLTGIFLGAYGQGTALRRRQGRGGERASGGGKGNGDLTTAFGSPSPTPALAPSPLSRLLDALCTRVPGLRRLRLSSLEPGDLSGDLLAALRAHAQVVPHFHLPLQSGSDAMLRRMNRQYTRDDFLRMVDAVRAAFDRPALTTDVIAGFPGETDADFAATTAVAEAAGFIHVHAFHYSPRPGTAAARWPAKFVRGPVVNERIEALRAIADRHGLALRRSFVGQTVELLVEHEKEPARDAAPRGTVPAGTEGHPTLRHGRSERYFPVWFEDASAKPGDFARVRVDEVTAGRTHGTRVRPA
ncbi:MAG: mtaB, partial [Phycisphaerales bacterium]|nr:mtaB [Phycisphaerales bacterium]